MNNLTNRENEVVSLVLQGNSNRKIGEILFISETTVKKHIYNIFNKLNINSRFELFSLNRSFNYDHLEKAS